ncbi:AraC family transcriptional regulator [Chelativorans salis]|uniref:AraC family transcriptional regulator n=1 Tax=Chelativorans salis TaxID=2978478 RepID=A0ABT2LQG2_9HYPH|nr:AraC family transcriptional regulator [Chelativorans sp. EGI FJ00035]MCT7376792.1 AraC family transcriptional regulator [Chelativorans sp. EGI FJ00035]
MDSLKQAVQAYGSRHANRDGLAPTPVPGLLMKYIEAPRGNFQAISRPLIVLVLQGAKSMIVGREERILSAGQTGIVSADMPMVTRILQASTSQPYLAIGVELEIAILCDVASELGVTRPKRPPVARNLFAQDTEVAALDCMSRLMHLIDRPEAIRLLRPGIMWELSYWLLSGQHGASLLELCDPARHASRLASAIAILRAEYRSRIPIELLAAAAGMSLSVFHKHFKRMTSLTPGQYQKRLRLVEARRLMLEDDASASSAAFAVGYESVSQFTREYGRLFQAPPKRDTLRVRSEPDSKARVRKD